MSIEGESPIDQKTVEVGESANAIPAAINSTLELPTFGAIVGVNTGGVQCQVSP